MITEKTTLEVLNEVQDVLKKEGYPVKLDIGEAIEGADIGIKVYVDAEENWELEKKINRLIQSVLEKNDLISYLEWFWKEDG